MDYFILDDDNKSDLMEKVKRWLIRGWRCQGGICITRYGINNSYINYAQALVKK